MLRYGLQVTGRINVIYFSSVMHTTELSQVHIRLFPKCHEKRNLAEYEGYYEVDEQLLSELIENTKN